MGNPASNFSPPYPLYPASLAPPTPHKPSLTANIKNGCNAKNIFVYTCETKKLILERTSCSLLNAEPWLTPFPPTLSSKNHISTSALPATPKGPRLHPTRATSPPAPPPHLRLRPTRAWIKEARDQVGVGSGGRGSGGGAKRQGLALDLSVHQGLV